MAMKFGLLLPHFGEEASRDKLLDGSRRAEELGFDSVWVRDHLVFEPHGEMEKPNRTFYDALTTLTAIGAVTSRIALGTGSLIPFRHPLMTALMTATLTQLVGPRLILGFGAGTFDHGFQAIGWGDRDRVELVRSNAEILRRVFTENHVTYSDDNFSFSDVTIEPKPVGGRIPFWYCGATPRSARLAVEFCDGWMPGRISLLTMDKRIATMRELSEQQRKPMPTVAVIPPTSETIEDLEGQLIVGNPDEAVAEVQKFARLGVEHLGVVAREVVDAADGWAATEGGVGSVMVGPMDPGCKARSRAALEQYSRR
jgi:alkanesulfonate monooxygenase SsuD/methylene tetrahydromethanopterin reductase-like flavin-dependent oxidoreductase (luciferase family)